MLLILRGTLAKLVSNKPSQERANSWQSGQSLHDAYQGARSNASIPMHQYQCIYTYAYIEGPVYTT